MPGKGVGGWTPLAPGVLISTLTNVLTFGFQAITDIYRHARLSERGLGETGGLLAGSDERVTWALSVPNRASQPDCEFSIEPLTFSLQLEEISQLGLELIGTWHTHPLGQPYMSAADAAMAGSTGPLLIVALGERWEWALWDPLAGGRVQFAIAPPVA